MRSLLLFTAAFFTFIGGAQDIGARADALSEKEFMKGARLSVLVEDMSTGELIASHGADGFVLPASSLKLLTVYAAMDILGPEHRFETRIGHTGSIDAEGRLAGDIIIQAGGDPSLGSTRFREHYASNLELAPWLIDIFRQAGIRSIQGRIIIDESHYADEVIPDGWSWQDIGNYYAAGSHAFSYLENRSILFFDSRASDGSTKLRSMEPALDLVMVNEVKGTDTRSDQAYVYAAPYAETMFIRGEIPRGEKEYEVKAAMTDPAALFLAELQKQCAYAGIDIVGEELELATTELGLDVQGLETIVSPKLSVILAHTLMRSDNVFAEHLVKQIGAKKSGKGSTDVGLKAMAAWMRSKGIDADEFVLRDGSGLSRGNSVTAQGFLSMLRALDREPYAHELIAMLPVAGQSGSMRRIGKGTALEGRMKAKTGYIDRVRSYVGFYEDGPQRYGVVCIANDYRCSASEMRKALSQVLIGLVE